MLARSLWRTRGTAARTTLTVLATAALAIAAAPPAAAAPSGQPGGTSAVLDSGALDQLQQRAAEVQAGLQGQQTEVAAAREELAEAERAVAAAEAGMSDAAGELAVHQAVVAGYAAAVYRDGGSLTPLTLLLSGEHPGDVVSAMAFLDVVDAHAAEVIGAAETVRQAALDQQQRAAAALAQARERADAVAARVADLEAAASAVTAELDEVLGAVDRQLAQLQQEQLPGSRPLCSCCRPRR
jgi:septal ring factor EnvC (AmiA/AmiB activator)